MQHTDQKAFCLLPCCLSLAIAFQPMHFVAADSADSVDLFSLDIADLMAVEVSSVSKRKETTAEAPATVMVISAEQIFHRSYTDLEQVLHDLPGFDISRGYGVSYSNIYQRGYRSSNTDRTLLLIDGVEENDIWKGTAWISRQYPLINIKRIEVIYGPSSTIYGANAFLGVINIITRGPEELVNDDGELAVDVNVGAGSWDTRFVDLQAALRVGDLALSLSGRRYRSEEMDIGGFANWNYDLPATFSRQDYADKLGTDDRDAIDLAIALDQQAYYSNEPAYSNDTDNWLIHLRGNYRNLELAYQSWKRKEGTGAWYPDYRLGPDHDSLWVPANWFAYLKYEYSINDNTSLTLFSRYKEHAVDDSSQRAIFKGYANNSGFDLDALTAESGPRQPLWERDWSWVHSDQWRHELKLDYRYSETLEFVGGLEYRDSSLQGNTIRGKQPNPRETGSPIGLAEGQSNRFSIQDTGVFGQASVQLNDRLRLIAGGRYDHQSIDGDGGYGTVFNPRLALVYNDQRNTVKLIYGEAFKDADNWSKFSTTSTRQLANPNLSPESVRNTELLIARRFGEHFYSELSFYHANYSGIAGEVPVQLADGSITFQNQAIGSLRIRGVQGRSQLNFGRHSLALNYGATDPVATSSEPQQRVADISDFHLNAEYQQEIAEGLHWNLRFNYVGERETGEGTSLPTNPNTRVGSYWLFNTALSYEFASLPLALQLSVNNVLDESYFDPGVRAADDDKYAALIPGLERSLFLQLRYRY